MLRRFVFFALTYIHRFTDEGYRPQLTQIIADKEKKSSSYKESKLESLSDEKVAKIKKFAKDYIAKVLHKMEKSGKKRNGSSSSTVPTHATSSASEETPNPHGEADGADVAMAEMSVEEAMDLEDDSGDDEDGENDHQEADQASPAQNVYNNQDDPKVKTMDVWTEPSDPRLRHAEESINGWDRDRGGSALFVGS